MPFDAHAFPLVDEPVSGILPAAAAPPMSSPSGGANAAMPGLFAASAAASIATFYATSAALSSARGTGPLAIVVPSAGMVVPLKRALRSRVATAGCSWVPPRVDTLAGYAAAADPGRVVRSRFARLLALADRLAEPGGGGWPGLLERAGALLDLIDALERRRAIAWLGAPGSGALPATDERALVVLLEDAARTSAARSDLLLGPDLRLLASLAAGLAEPDDPVAVDAQRWRMLLSQWEADGVTVVRVGLRPLGRGPDGGPAGPGQDDATAAIDVPDPDDQVLLAMVRAAPALAFVDLHPDPRIAMPKAAQPFFAAWPEAFPGPEPATAAPIADRRLAADGAAVQAGSAADLLHVRTREDEAAVATGWVHRVLSQGARSVAIVVLDRWLARRTRALLERSGVLIDDREGWALSTTVAASWPMAWLDYCEAVGASGRRGVSAAIALSTLLDSAFTGHPAAPALASYVRSEQRSAAASAVPEAHALDVRLSALAERQRQAGSLRAHREALAQAMTALGADVTMQRDEAGRQLLELIEALPAHAPAGCRLDAFRALLGFALESRRFHDAGIASPVTMIGLDAAIAQSHDAVLVLGASDSRLPAAQPLPPGISEPMLPRLGLAPILQQRTTQTRMLAWVLAGSPRRAVTCRTSSVDGTLPSPLVERLAAIAGIDLAEAQERVALRTLPPARPGAAAADGWPMPRPAEPVVRMPATLPVGAIGRLVGCPYEFLVGDLWGLRDSEDPADAPGRRELGLLVHDVLLRFHRAVPDPESHDDAALAARLAALTDDVVAATPMLRADRLVRLHEWLALIPRYVEQFRRDHAEGWRFVDGEVSVEARIGYPARAGDAALVVRGTYDRIDRLDRHGGRRRIVDYKLQSPLHFRKAAREPDLAAQLMLYCLSTGAEEAVYLVMDRKGIDVAALDPPPVDTLPRWRERLAGQLGRIADGEPLRALGSHCARCRVRGVCRQGHWHDRASELARGGGGDD